MITWWLGCGILFILFVVIINLIDIKVNFGDDVSIFMSAVFIAVLLGLTCVCYISSDYNTTETNIRYSNGDKFNIYSIEDNFKLNGSFVMGSGMVNSELTYYVMIGDDKNGYTIKSFPAKETYLFPGNAQQPYYVEVHKIYDIAHAKNFLFGGLFKPLKSIRNVDTINKYNIYLPKNYVKQNYNIDMK